MSKKKIANMSKTELLAHITKMEADAKANAVILKENEIGLDNDKQQGDENPDAKFSGYTDDEVEIRPDRYIRIISLCPHPLNLSTSKTGGKQFRFREIGDMKRIIYQDVVDIIETHPVFTEEGLFFIADKDVVYRHGLVEYYDAIISKEQIDVVLGATDDVALAIFKTANPRQQRYIADMIIQKIANGQEVDRNFVYAASEECGIDIEQKAQEEKEYKEILVKEAD